MSPCELVADNDRLSDENEQLRADLAAQKALTDVAVAEANDSEAECITLRASLATVSAEREAALKEKQRLENEIVKCCNDTNTARSAEAETRKALEYAKSTAAGYETLANDLGSVADLRLQANESTRAELARSEARVKELEAENERAMKLCESLQRGFARG